MIGPGGELYKCWNHLGDEAYVVGTVFEPMELSPLYSSYLRESFENDDECGKCKYLPICMGGCVDIRVKSKRGEFDGKDCSAWKYYLDDVLKEYYLARMN